MNKEEYIIKINEEEILVNKQIYDFFLPLGKIIEDLSSNNEQLQNNWNSLKEWIKEYPAIHYSSTEKVNGIRLSGKLIREDNLFDKMQELESRK